VILDEHLKVLRATQSYYQKFQVNENDTEGHSCIMSEKNQWDIPEFKEIAGRSAAKSIRKSQILKLAMISAPLAKKTLLLNARELNQNNQQILLSIEDVTAQAYNQ